MHPFVQPSRHQHDAKKIFAWIQHSERSLELADKNVWDSWLECLCRCGELQEAMHYTFNDMEPALRKRAEVLKYNRSSTTSKHIYYETIKSELTRRNNNEHAEKQKYSSGFTEEPQQLKRYSSKGLSTYGLDVKTFNLLLGFAHSKVNNNSYGFTQPGLHAEIIHRLHIDYSELLPFINPTCLIAP